MTLQTFGLENISKVMIKNLHILAIILLLKDKELSGKNKIPIYVMESQMTKSQQIHL